MLAKIVGLTWQSRFRGRHDTQSGSEARECSGTFLPDGRRVKSAVTHNAGGVNICDEGKSDSHDLLSFPNNPFQGLAV